MDFISKKDIPYFLDCEPIVTGLGYKLVELNVFRQKNGWAAKIVIAADKSVGVEDCSKAHKVLLPRLEVILDSQDIYMEVTSPGLDRVIKKSTEFEAFTGKTVSVWTLELGDWLTGLLAEVSESGIILDVQGVRQEIQLKNIKKAKLVV